jgi:hypothetical protein
MPEPAGAPTYTHTHTPQPGRLSTNLTVERRIHMSMRSLLRRCFRHHTPAAAYVALVLALGGTAYAAITVTGENIVDGSITSADIGTSEVKTTNLAPDGVSTDKLGTAAVTDSKVADESLTGNDVKNGSLTGLDVRDGLLGGADLADNSVKGEDIDLEVYRSVQITPESVNVDKTAEATCAPGWTVLGGGGRVTNSVLGSGIEKYVKLSSSSPSSSGQGWRVAATSRGSDAAPWFSLTAYAICAKV